MNSPPKQTSTASTTTVKPRFQISLGFLMLTMVVCSVVSAGLLYASRVPAVQEEIAVLKGSELGDNGQGRLPHLMFILFTFTSPLLLAGILSTALSVLRWARTGKSG